MKAGFCAPSSPAPNRSLSGLHQALPAHRVREELPEACRSRRTLKATACSLKRRPVSGVEASKVAQKEEAARPGRQASSKEI